MNYTVKRLNKNLINLSPSRSIDNKNSFGYTDLISQKAVF